jgi:hypothetical protein
MGIGRITGRSVVPIREAIEQQLAAWTTLGVPAVLDKIILRAGSEFRLDPKAEHGNDEAKLCFQNSIHYAVNFGMRYVEGYAIRPGLGLLIHHAWVDLGDGLALDPTWEGCLEDKCEYYGVSFDADDAWAQMVASGHYGIFDFAFPANREFVRNRWSDVWPKEKVR